MAEAPPVVDKGLKELHDELTCPVCHEVFEEPKILPCCHYYCKKCIQKLVNLYARRNRPFECPECRQETTVPQNDPNQLTTAHFINRLKELEGKMEKAHGKVEAPCEQCSGGVSKAFCRQCTEFVCAECVKQHQRMKAFSGHKIVTLEELKKGGAKQILVSKPPPPKCTIHDEPMKAYCYDCSSLICRDCMGINHAGHKSEFTKVAAPETKKLLNEHLAPLKEVKVSLHKNAKVVQVTISEVTAQGASVAENIEQSFQELHKILEEHKNRLLVEASDTVDKKVTELSTQEKGLNMASAAIQGLVDFAEQNLENSTDEELMMVHKQILTRIEKEAEEHRKGATDLEPFSEEVEAEIAIAEHLKELCKTKTKIVTLPVDPSKSKLDGPGLNSAKVNQQTHVIVHTMLLNGAPSKQPQNVTAELKSLVNGSVSQLEGVRKEANKYEIQFSSSVRGRHQLEVNVNDQPIAGSPFPVYVNIPPTQLGKPVRIIGGLNEPYGVAVNSVGEVLVTELKKIVVFDKKGNQLSEIKIPNAISLRGIAIDKDDNIYVTDGNFQCLIKCSKTGEVLKTIGSNGQIFTEFNAPLHLTIVGDQVIMCDSGNKCLQVFNKENLLHVRTISLESEGQEPVGIDHDELGNLYISDFMSSSIGVLNEQGEFQFSFSKKDNGQLNRPNGVCIAGHFVCVVEFGGNCVSIFSRDGQFVKSFGKRGSRKGEFEWPFGICADCDGFVYVCDYNNHRVQVF